MEFEWDEAKSNACYAARDFDVLFATGVFIDPLRDVTIDDRVDYGERRYRATGQAAGRILVVVHTLRNGRYRLISARRANRKEVRAYGYRQSNIR